MNLTIALAKLTLVKMEWQYWINEAQFHAQTCGDNEGRQMLFQDAQARAEFFRNEYSKTLQAISAERCGA
jgi:hypothetical protein